MPARSSTVQVSPEEHKREERDGRGSPPRSEEIQARVQEQFEGLLAFAQGARGYSFCEFERELVGLVFALGRLLAELFLCQRHEELKTAPSEVIGGKRYQRAQAQSRRLGTFFGKVRYWRTYLHAPGGGEYPLDRLLKLPVHGFSLLLTSLMTRLATQMSYEQVTRQLRLFLGWSPSKTTVEAAVLGLGRHTAPWFANAPLPEDDGEVLVIMFDGKATPTATEAELQKRRGKRRPPRVEGSPRHRGRQRRRWRGRKKRRKKGNHSKNGKAANVVVIYTLKRGFDVDGEPVLKGPIGRRIYASYASKRHAFAIARRQADRRGFAADSGKTVQIVTDGDADLARLAKEVFPEAIHTLDVMHALESIWKAGRSLYREGSEEIEAWVDKQRRRLYEGRVEKILCGLRKVQTRLSPTGPGSKAKRQGMKEAIRYLERRVPMMNYAELIEQDLEISSGPVEGAVRYVVAQRFDCAGMRWIKERSEALLQLRCIEVNGEWEEFIRFVHRAASASANGPSHKLRLLASTPQPLPDLELAA
jgi:hypothetical protein